MTDKYKSGNTRVLLDLGPLYGPLSAYASEVDLSLAAVIRLILRDVLSFSNYRVTLPPIDRGNPANQVQDTSVENDPKEVA